MVCERETNNTTIVMDAILFEDEIIRVRVAAKTEKGVMSDFVPGNNSISVSRGKASHSLISSESHIKCVWCVIIIIIIFKMEKKKKLSHV